jgi:FkbM family methyltransferase
MKHLTTIKDNKWVWPANDENSWPGQNEFQDLAKWVLPHVKEKNIMIQAGGNCGFMLSNFVEHFNTIYTFEPDPINFYCLNQNVTSQNVIKMQCCLGNDTTPVTTQHLIRPDRPNDIGGVHISGAGFTPSVVIDNLSLPGCDLIQLDVEGYELNALLGAENTIKKYSPVLCIEFCEKWLNRYNTSSNKILGLLEEWGYIQADEYGVDKIFIKK